MATQGSCLCGTMRYEIDGPFSMMMNCHCSMCRKHHGAPFATFAGAPASGFRWISGDDHLGHYESSPGGKRSFCITCGTVAPLFMGDMVIVPAGTFDSDPGIRLQRHIFVGSKAPWHSISDGLPQHEEYPPEFAGAKAVPRPSVSAEPGKTLGSCLCGEVAYEISGPAMLMYQCHCRRCRKARSAAHGANLFYKAENFRWLRGESQVVDYPLPEAKRFGCAFCRTCGGSTPRVSAASGTVVVPAGALDTDPGMKPMAHIFVGSKPPWLQITDSIPQFEELPPR
jgi:hypothetical protein